MERVLNILPNSTLYVGRTVDILPKVLPAERVVVITDANIDRLYPDLVHRYEHIIIGGGEAMKSLRTVADIYDRLMAMGADRSTFLLGIGGGIVTDITGFVAATYMRGLSFGFISTTLLGQVDASIGGKNGVNVAGYKNMVGTFSQPRFVISDVEMLRTLPCRERRAGMAEALKSAIVGDASLFDYIEANATEDIYSSVEHMRHIVTSAVMVKAGIVASDELEGGRRRVLNLGHTLGHAIEKCCHDINHGEAVAMGLSLISHAASKYGLICYDDVVRIDSTLLALGFTIEPPQPIQSILREVKHDKKRRDNILRVVLPERIGQCRIVEMPIDEFEQLF